MSADRALIHRAASVLEKGPTHTVALAYEALGLTGNPGAASAAVFTLLGPDSRFQVDGEGVWSMAGPRPGTLLSELCYAVVDVETTGGSYGLGHRMTEIAIYEVRGGVVEDEYRSLVNPGRNIPRHIAVLTGISNDMVSSAPFFDHIAADVLERLEGRIFVAHNARFRLGLGQSAAHRSRWRGSQRRALVYGPDGAPPSPPAAAPEPRRGCAALRDRRRGSPPGPRRCIGYRACSDPAPR